jgi:hypothetical protein
VEEKIRNTLVVGQCDTIQNRNNCESVDEQSPIFIRRFYPKNHICIQRQGKNIIETKMVTEYKDNECPESYRNCGPDGKPEYQLCVSNKFDCPIIDVKYDVSDNKMEGYTEVSLGSGKSIYYSSTNSDSGLPLVEFVLSEGVGDDRGI